MFICYILRTRLPEMFELLISGHFINMTVGVSNGGPFSCEAFLLRFSEPT